MDIQGHKKLSKLTVRKGAHDRGNRLNNQEIQGFCFLITLPGYDVHALAQHFCHDITANKNMLSTTPIITHLLYAFIGLDSLF